MSDLNNDFSKESQQPVKSGNSRIIYMILIAVIIFFVVIIVLMSTSMRAMINGGNNQPESNNQNNIMTTENQQVTTEEITEEETTTTQTTTITTTTVEPITEIVTVTVIVTVTEPAFPSYTYKVNNVGLVVYENASFDSKPTGYISDRGTYTIVDQYQNWGKLESGGWINFDIASQNGSITYIGIGEIVTKKDPLNLRCAPDSDAKILTSIPKGTSVEIYESEFSDWYYTTYNGQTGFVSSEYISFDNYHMTDIQGYFCSGVVATKKDPLNVRSEPSTDASVVTTIPKGTTIDLYMTNNSNWYYTTYGGVSGYVNADYITLVLSGGYYGYTDYSTATVKTNGSNLYIRDAASMDGNILDKMPNGTTVNIIEYGSSWCYVEYNGTRGYASTDYLSF
ncbi:MAG: SH3 domain-containing protein [Prevotella sp.]|nr:SH3 domain-containing protein [Alistipes senegalensis]MCM1358047.1 SH3 domain-containing protein [Prevotella sp.]MCM1472902.1 SH3 domain-containing protein [Muribaculaceae bacterium]